MSNQQKRNWFARHKVLTVILAFVVIGIIAAAAGGGSSNTSGGAKASNNNAKTYRFADRADKQAKDVELLPNESGTVDGVKLAVTGAEYKTAISDFETAANGKTYVIADVSLENTSDRTKPYNPFDFRIQTAGGQVLDPTVTTVKTLDSGDLVTGGKASGKIVFEVPVEDGHQYLIWKPGLSSDRAIVQVK
ncbi:MAG TPA: DUF4352 domain-containing protein [Candidatus Saccharimonadales bacterium]|nr:DUF4352 domain-containing protein [Candidatus Saccharimonadales bacterium]